MNTVILKNNATVRARGVELKEANNNLCAKSTV